MNYGYIRIGANYSTLIKKFEIKDNLIIITNLDGSKYKLEYNEENEKKVLNIMIEQAIERDKTLNNMKCYGDFEFEKADLFDYIIKYLINCGESCYFYTVFGGFTMTSILSTAIAAMTARNDIAILGNTLLNALLWLTPYPAIIEYFKDKKMYAEFEKYSIYLNFMEQYKKNINNPNLCNGIKTNLPELNINTLDNYSLKDIKTIKNNLDKIILYEDNKNTKKLIKN